MLREAASYTFIAVMSFACLGLVALCMVRDELRDANVGPSD